MKAGCVDVFNRSRLRVWWLARLCECGDGYLGWRWIFITEGLISAVIGLFRFFTVSE